MFDFFVLKKYLFIYLAALGLSCGMWDLRCHMRDLRCHMQDLHCGVVGSLVAVCGIFQLWHVGSSSLTRDRTWAPCTGSTEP